MNKASELPWPGEMTDLQVEWAYFFCGHQRDRPIIRELLFKVKFNVEKGVFGFYRILYRRRVAWIRGVPGPRRCYS